MKITSEKIFFDPALQAEIKSRFYYVNEDYLGRKRQFFENSGGSLRLKAAVEEKSRLENIPDCPERVHDTSMMLKKVKADGIRDIMEVIFGANPGEGALVTELTASQCMFQIVRTIMENAPGTNAVTTSIEHPSSYDSVKLYCERTGKEFRVAMANPATGGVELEEILSHVDQHTALLSIMSASNISGYLFDMETIVNEVRKINPDIYIVSDEEALETAQRLAREEGLMCGISSGTNVAAAIQLAKKLGPGKTVVTVLPDTAERYFSTPLFEE